MRILLVDDNRTNLCLLTRLVEKLDGCDAYAFLRPQDVIDQLPFLDFDVAIIDFQMPVYNGIELMNAILVHEKYRERPFVFVTADTDTEIRMAALNAGAIDFLTKPINPLEFTARVKNLAALADARNKLADRAEWLRVEVERATSDLREREHEIIYRLTLAAGYKDPETGRHTMRVGAYAEAIARAYGLGTALCNDIRWAAPMHDIGKVAIPDVILLKQGKLTESEYTEMQRHASVGQNILAGSHSRLLQLAAEIAGGHHERWDGRGYPRRLKADAIPISARLVAVADTFDALTTARPYKEAWSVERAISLVLASAGTQFDPECVSAFQRALPEILDIMAAQQDPLETCHAAAVA